MFPGLDVFGDVAGQIPGGVEILCGVGDYLRPGHFRESEGGKMVTIPGAECSIIAEPGEQTFWAI